MGIFSFFNDITKSLRESIEADRTNFYNSTMFGKMEKQLLDAGWLKDNLYDDRFHFVINGCIKKCYTFYILYLYKPDPWNYINGCVTGIALDCCAGKMVAMRDSKMMPPSWCGEEDYRFYDYNKIWEFAMNPNKIPNDIGLYNNDILPKYNNINIKNHCDDLSHSYKWSTRSGYGWK